MLVSRGKKAFSLLFLIFAISIFLLTRPHGILMLQEVFDVPGSVFVVGDARIVKPSGWFLTSCREGEGHKMKYLGALPEWIYRGDGFPKNRYFIFEDISSEQISFTFVETDAEKRRKIAAIVAENKAEKGGCRIERPALSGHDGVVCSDENSVSIYLPDVGVTAMILGGSRSLLDGLKISKK